jgi:hypothetical protein
MIVRTLNFCAKIKKEKNRKKGEHIPVSTFFPFLIHHIPFVIPPVWFPESHSVIFLIQQIPLGITHRGFRRWDDSVWFQAPTYYSSTRSVIHSSVWAVAWLFSYHDSVRFSSNWFSNTRPHFHHASTPCGFSVPNKTFCPFFIQNIRCLEFFKWLLSFPRPRPIKSV